MVDNKNFSSTVAEAKTWATAHIVAAVAIGLAIGIVIGLILPF